MCIYLFLHVALACSIYDLTLAFHKCVMAEKSHASKTDDDEAAGEGLLTEENNNTSAEFDLGSGRHPQASIGKETDGEDSGRELSFKNDSRATEDVDLDEVDGFLNDNVQVETEDTYPTTFPEEWASWHEALKKLKHSIVNESRVLNSIKELIHSGEAFSSQVDFRGIKVRSGLAEALGRFFEFWDLALRYGAYCPIRTHRAQAAMLGRYDEQCSRFWAVFLSVSVLFSSSNSRSFYLQLAHVATSYSTLLNVETLVVGIIIFTGEIASDPYTKYIKCGTYLFVHKRHLNGSLLNHFWYIVALSTKYLLVVLFNLCASLTLLSSVLSMKKVELERNAYDGAFMTSLICPSMYNSLWWSRKTTSMSSSVKMMALFSRKALRYWVA
ncbi:hypothetical protein D8674_034918 [Pyrus ussuriensis x Pyrus communis]|uniref:Uncharacterized protein n=1 Tax=Pyrus ussuriensis x Pyrus communis TaxID=2448454 RepID=A0A5N5GGI4_9ROSA|nr:hypothetical protein D8674_034918 [Pyrus ussuriensis x Pyrus communis]